MVRHEYYVCAFCLWFTGFCINVEIVFFRMSDVVFCSLEILGSLPWEMTDVSAKI